MIESNKEEEALKIKGELKVDIGEWKDGSNEFNIFEWDLQHILTPRGNTGPSLIIGAERNILDFWQLYMDDPFLLCIITDFNSLFFKYVVMIYHHCPRLSPHKHD